MSAAMTLGLLLSFAPACDGESVWRTTGCVPGNLTPCEAPGEITGTCSAGVGKR
jgi:hypothetical protein